MLLSVVIPVYNEESVLPLLLDRLGRTLAGLEAEHEVLLIDDGSTDRSLAIASEAAARNPRYKVLAFSRNFGHQAALTAGLDFAEGDAVVMLDADLQDPPELLPIMLQRYREGFEVVSAQRRTRAGEGFFKKATADGFYWMMGAFVDRRLKPQVGDFRLLSREAVHAVRGFREQHRFLRGIIAWLGLKETTIQYDRDPRAAGVSKYSLHRMLRFCWTAISSSSGLPLRLTIWLGGALAIAGTLFLAPALVGALRHGSQTPGWELAVASQAVFTGLTLLCLGLSSDCLARGYEEAKRRPLYVVSESHNVNATVRPNRAIVLRGTTPGREK